MKVLAELCSIPTAPFVESRVVQYVERFAAKRKLALSRDRFGNLLLELPANAKSKFPRWVFTAHMDHPGFVARTMLDKRTLEAEFRGGVHPDYFVGSRVRFFDADREITGVVAEYSAKQIGEPGVARVRVSGPVPPGSLGMWDQGVGRTKGKKFYSRVCDDLAGAAAALEMLDRLRKRLPAGPVAVLLTRGEEEGFVGAIAASIRPQLLRKTDRIVAIECSAEQPYAPQGKGAIIRVGDRTSVFHSGLTYFLTRQAEELAKRDKSFAFQRALMPGGTCEATVYDIYGFSAASICVALGNYHNMNKTQKRIGPEYIHLRDWENMVKLFVAVARNGHTYEPGHAALRERVEKRFAKWRPLLGPMRGLAAKARWREVGREEVARQ